MISERHLNHILKEMDYTILSVAKEISKEEFPIEGINVNGEHLSIKYLREKVGLMKFYVDWIRVDMEEDGA